MLYVMIGIPGSGKSYIAHKLAEEGTAVIHSSDDIREELYGDASIQGDGAKVFATLHNRVRRDLEEGKNVIYDATNLTFKGRKNIFKMFGEYPMAAVYVECSLKTALARNQKRDRVVPEDVIRRFYFKMNPPDSSEGWKEIIQVNNEN